MKNSFAGKYTWNICVELNKHGANIKALTVWVLLGVFSWNKLLTQPGGDYESCIFDLRFPSPRPTVLATLVKALSNGKDFQHPVLKQKEIILPKLTHVLDRYFIEKAS